MAKSQNQSGGLHHREPPVLPFFSSKTLADAAKRVLTGRIKEIAVRPERLPSIR